ncbi:unnamed protein product [Pylaiella littoralis]
MGRKRGLPARAREKLVAEEAAAAIDLDRKEAVLQAKPDEALFVLDAAGSGRKRRKIQKEAKTAKYLSKNEKKLVVHKYLGKGKARAANARKRISDPWAEGEEEGEGDKDKDKEALPSTRGKAGTGDAKPLLSLEGGGEEGGSQGGDGFVVAPRVPGRNVKRPKQSVRNLAKLGVCHPGQSYNPAEDDHEDVLASAVAVELKRQAAIEEESAPVSAGMSKETLAVIVGDEDDEESSDEDDGSDNAGVSLGKPTPASGKLTRAQRNKQKRAKAAKHEVTIRRAKKDMTKSIGQVTALQREVADEERLRKERRQTKRLLKAEKAKIEAEGATAGGVFGPSTGVAAMSAKRHNKDVIAGRSVPVNLGEELYGSLRQLKAQGSILLDKVELLKNNKAHPDRRRGKERAKKAPKGFKKKHTYKDRYKDD